MVSVPRALAVPMIEAAFPRRLHPYWPKLQEKSRTWLREMRLMPPDKVERYADSLCYTDLVAGYYIGAPDELLTAIADLSSWFFAWDDRHDRDSVHGRAAQWQQLCQGLHGTLDEPRRYRHHKDPLVAGFADCVLRLYSFLGPSWNARFARHFHPVIDAYDQEFRNRRCGTVPTVEAYIELRRLTFAHWAWIDLLEPTARYELPDPVRKHPAYRRAARATQDFSAWYNDLCSLPKELAGDELHNLGISLIQHEGMTLEEAVREVHRRVTECVKEFLEAEREVLQFADELAEGGDGGTELADAVKACVFNMRNWFSSVYWFHHESGRYRVDSWDDRSMPPYVTEESLAENELVGEE
ncbi:multidrug MFS transporter [Streptomyces sp. SID335]|uniref:Terpene synthase n=1 Tax=Streptomyces venezuelae TaxID=54571 RepID=A0A5P2BH18_STRVZ|nr:multidrug MFS transporter [Streptomyces sp. SID335]MYZ13929.1 multidrug MFS transporter [Streptomyces sp. SID337]QES29387.1 multidrug MFS transporter [Streptomyces venezuelae]